MAVAVLGANHSTAADKRPPNVVLFLVDDMGWMDCGTYGSQYYVTPQIDAFAKRSMRFTNAYSQPLCSPTRASLLTGQYSARHRITSATGHLPPQPANFEFLPATAPANEPMLRPESKNYLEPAQYTLAEALRDAGYRTAHLGKWHLGLTTPHWPEQQGFDTAFHCHPDPGPPGDYFSPYGVTAAGAPKPKNKVGTITDGPAGEYIVDRLAAEAERFIEANRDRPFFLNLWNYGVHGPWGHKTEYTAAAQNVRDPSGRQGNPIMASMLRSVDECFGRVLAALERHGLTENTIVIFTSDNGGNTHSNTRGDEKNLAQQQEFLRAWRRLAGEQPPTNNAPLRDGKGTLYEGGTRVPLMWCWPSKIAAGTTTDAVVGPIDVYPTLLALLGLDRRPEQVFDGRSYASLLRGDGQFFRAAYFNYHPHGGPGRAGGVTVRAGDWKLFRWFAHPVGSAERYELYNLRDDLGEASNIAASQPERVRQLEALINEFLTDTGALYPRPNPAYRPRVAPAAAPDDGVGPLAGWKLRGMKLATTDRGVQLIGGAKAFVGTAKFRFTGPAEVRLVVHSPQGGTGEVHWRRTAEENFNTEQRGIFNLQATGDEQTAIVAIPDDSDIAQWRVYLPLERGPLELRALDVRAVARPAATK